VALTPQASATIEGGFVRIGVEVLCCLWISLMAGRIRPLDIRTFLGACEVRERRKFLSRGRQAIYRASELDGLVAHVGERKVRSSLRRLERARLLRWRDSGVTFIRAINELEADLQPGAEQMLARMPKRRRFIPLPRRVLRLLCGGVKRSVLATTLGHVARCVHHSKDEGWSGVGACKASWVADTFGLSERSVIRARGHLIHALGWLKPVETDQWYANKWGGRFEVQLDWNHGTPAEVSCSQGELSTAKMSPPNGDSGTRLSPPESKQNSSSRIRTSEPVSSPPGPRDESWKKEGGGPPVLAKLVRQDLPSVERVMELFDQALTSPLWRKKGWTPTDGHLERLNWAAAARRAHVRGGTNPCGLFVHLVSQRKWEHISNEDEEAVRREVSRWLNPEPEASTSGGGGARRMPPKLSKDAKTVRFVEATLKRHKVDSSVERVDRELKRYGWTELRIEAARRSVEAWRTGEAAVPGLLA